MLRRILQAAAATATVTGAFGAGVPAASAQACISGTPPNPVFPCTGGPAGRMCSFASTTDPTPEAPADTQTGVMNVGPLFVRTPGPKVYDDGEVKCTVQVGGSGVHSDPDSTAFMKRTDDTIPGVFVGARVVSFISPSQVPVYLCTQYTKNGVTAYWTGAGWSSSSASKCGQALGFGTDDPIFDPVWETVDTVGTTVDSVSCPVLVAGAGDYAGVVTIAPDGDTYVAGEFVRDCPPYWTAP